MYFALTKASQGMAYYIISITGTFELYCYVLIQSKHILQFSVYVWVGIAAVLWAYKSYLINSVALLTPSVWNALG
jgi:hypothetical protein